MKAFDINAVAEQIGIPVTEWPGKCYQIASAMVAEGIVEDATAVYGHWTGDINPKGYFGDRSHLPFCQHGWIQTEDGEVIDPTRWVFENVDPYIFVGYEEWPDFTPCRHCGHVGDEHDTGFLQECTVCDCSTFEAEPWPYDEGGNEWRAALQKPPPSPDGDDERKYVLLMNPAALTHVQTLLGDTSSAFTSKQVFWLANLAYGLLQPYAHEIYESFKLYEEERLDAYIPMDNRLRAEREALSGKRCDE